VEGEEVSHFCVFAPFGRFLLIFSQLKTFSKNLSAHIIIVLDATFMLNLTFLGLLSLGISFGEKNQPQIQLISPSVDH